MHAALREADGHLTAEEVGAALTAVEDEVPLSSVYRALGVLEDLGVARTTRLGAEGAARWELSHPDEHFHVECTGCGDVTHHRGSLVEIVTGHLRDDHGFVADEVRLLVRGRCPACRRATPQVPL